MKNGVKTIFFPTFPRPKSTLQVWIFKQCLEERVFCRYQYVFWIFILFHVLPRFRNLYCKQGELRQGCGCLAEWPTPGAVGVLSCLAHARHFEICARPAWTRWCAWDRNINKGWSQWFNSIVEGKKCICWELNCDSYIEASTLKQSHSIILCY